MLIENIPTETSLLSAVSRDVIMTFPKKTIAK